MSRVPFPTGAVPDLPALLAAHGLTGAEEEPFPHTGFSGATLTRIRRDDGASFVLKRVSIDRDWIMRATDDAHCRESAFARTPPALPPSLAHPMMGAAPDGDGFALLMEDITPHLLPQGIVPEPSVATILRAMAALHAMPAEGAVPALPWCSLERRVTLLTPQTSRIAEVYGASVAADIARGWSLFPRYAPPRIDAALRALFADQQPLLDALAPLPAALLHGDLKFDNIGIDPEGRVWLLDWAMPLIAPPAVELGWFLAINSRRMTLPLDEVMARYTNLSAIDAGHRERHNALTVLTGLLLRGWRKAIDADEGHPDELRWWCERAEAALRYI